MSSTVKKEGMLMVKKGKLGRWKNSWCELSGDGNLRYHDGNKRLKGKPSLLTCFLVQNI